MISITFREGTLQHEWQVLFTKTPLKLIQSNSDKPLYLYWNNFYCYFELDKPNDQYWFSSTFNEENGMNETFIHILLTREYSFEQFRIVEDREEISQMNNLFPKASYISESDIEIIVL